MTTKDSQPGAQKDGAMVLNAKTQARGLNPRNTALRGRRHSMGFTPSEIGRAKGSSVRPPKGDLFHTGFTLVELIVAMAFFSFMLAIISIGVVQVMRIYQSGVASRRTQQHARVAIEEIARDVRTASNVPASQTGSDRLCLEGDNTVEYIRTSAHRLEKRVLNTSSCPAAVRPIDILDTTTIIDGDAHNAQLRQFGLQPVFDTTGRVVSVEVVLVVTTGESDLLSGDGCDPEARGSQFCSTTELVGTVSLRGSDNETF